MPNFEFEIEGEADREPTNEGKRWTTTDHERHIAAVVAEPFKTFVSERDFGNGPVAKTRIKKFQKKFR